MQAKEILGWDIGGAHLKMARVDGAGAVLETAQFATPLWLGLHSLAETLESVRIRIAGRAARHAVTMTGELVDIFPSRSAGVRSLLDLFSRHFEPEVTRVYTLSRGLVPIAAARGDCAEVASANWHATTSVAAACVPAGILVDVGSTTTDIIPFADGRPRGRGATDLERLRSGELVYAGVVRTPVMAIVQRFPYAGHWQNAAAEYFASSADVYRLTGELDEADDMMAPADQGGKSVADSARRLARMAGTDAAPDTGLDDWRALAGYVAERQLDQIDASFRRVADGLEAREPPTVIGAGCGRFIARKLAARHALPYTDFDALLPAPAAGAVRIAVAATAVSVAQLARVGERACD